MSASDLALADVKLRYVTREDAALILRLRDSEVARQTLSTGAASLEGQRQWLAGYLERAAQGLEHYFIIELRREPVGAVRLYDLRRTDGSFTWGSWVIQAGTAPTVAWISAVLVYDLAFWELGLRRAEFEVRAFNHNVVRFHHSFGAKSAPAAGDLVRFTLDQADYAGIRAKFLQRIRLSPA